MLCSLEWARVMGHDTGEPRLDDEPTLQLPLETGRHAFVDDLASLDAIVEPALNLCIWRREPQPDYAAWLDALCASTHLDLEHRLDAARPDASALTRDLPAARWREVLQRDIEALALAFSQWTGGGAALVHLGTVHTDKCRRYHADFNRLRLLCTYSGLGTEWVMEHGIDRQGAVAVVRDPGAVRALHRFDVGVLKGNAWPGDEGRGCIHRSPPIEGSHGRRLLLKIDVA